VSTASAPSITKPSRFRDARLMTSPAQDLPPSAAAAERRVLVVPAELRGERLDRVLVALMPEYSRSRLQQWIEAGRVTVSGESRRPSDRLAGGEELLVVIEPERDLRVVAQALPIDIVYEDDALLVVNKPAGLVVHPGAGNPDSTLQNALLHHAPELAVVPRAGIIHRIDKDTSGLLVVARTLEAHATLVAALAGREIGREYEAIVCGVVTAGGKVDQPIGRDARDRTRMRVSTGARPAVTHYRVLERFRAHSLIHVKLETGRTHQIRVHMQHLRHPVFGDPVYGNRLAMPRGASPRLQEQLRLFRRQALHARRLSLHHPRSGAALSWEAALPSDMADLLDALRRDAAVTR
jgi:23S rRNA pseudouridine1911/1915/1917 synthase